MIGRGKWLRIIHRLLVHSSYKQPVYIRTTIKNSLYRTRGIDTSNDVDTLMMVTLVMKRLNYEKIESLIIRDCNL